MQASAINYPWEKEIEKVVVQSLCTSFGLDFLLFKDKVGGDVDTIHNARQNIYATDKAKQNYEQRGDYDSHAYHQNEDYIKKGREDKTLHQEGKLHDAYRNKTFSANDNRNLDHTISAKEIHDDPGRVLAGADGIELANDRSNLQSTSETINKIKKALPTEEFLEKLPQIIDDKKLKLEQTREALKNAPRHTPAEKHAAQELEQKIKKQKKA